MVGSACDDDVMEYDEPERREYVENLLRQADIHDAIEATFKTVEGGVREWRETPSGLTVVLNAPTASDAARECARQLSRKLQTEVTVMGDKES